jgi:predicted O-methyltransferase YrrM
MKIDLVKGPWTKENVNFTKRTLRKLDQDDRHLADINTLIDKGVPNIWLVLAYLAKAIKPERYMELGVRRGFSMALVGARRKTATLIGFDLWIPDYGGSPNPGPDFVKSELQKVGHTGQVNFVAGDCNVTVPLYDNSILCPLILADAAHDTPGVLADIKNCLPHLAPGGYLVVDDLQDANVRIGWERAVDGLDCWTWQKGRVGVIQNG